MMLVHVEDVPFYNWDVEDGFIIDRAGFVGWDDSPASKGETADIPNGHGEVDLPVFRSSRIATMTGLCQAATNERLQWYQGLLSSLGADGGTVRVQVDHHGTVQFADGRVVGTQFRQWGDVPAADFQIQIRFPNPRKYGVIRPFYNPGDNDTWTEAWHQGNFPAAPRFEVVGAMPTGYRIYGKNGLVFTVTQPLASGHTHVIDFATGTVTDNGSLLWDAAGQWNTWEVNGGEYVAWKLQPISGYGTVTCYVTDTYI